MYLSECNLKEYFKNICPNWEKSCYKRNDCGWCIDKNVNGKCIKGKRKGPENGKKKCENWFYKGNCIYGNQCANKRKYYYYKKNNKNNQNWEDILNEEECEEIPDNEKVP